MVKVNRTLDQGFCSCCAPTSRGYRVAVVRAARRRERQRVRDEIASEVADLTAEWERTQGREIDRLVRLQMRAIEDVT